ncbi:MAG: response regulator [Opitutaceae bacterium]|nr:response regulator [Opitutaceae bacterium]
MFLLAGGIALVGLLAGRWAYVQERDRLLAELVRDAERVAALVDHDVLSQLTGTAADAASPAYAALKTRLKRYRVTNASIRFIYVFRVVPGTRQVVFLVDSEPVGSPDISLPGDDYPEAARSPGLQAMIDGNRFSTEGPLADSFGVWVTAYALVAQDQDGATRDFVGVDLAANTWRWELWVAGGRVAALVWLLGGLPLTGYHLWRRQREQTEVIRNLSEAIDQSHTAVMIVDLNGRIEYANLSFCEQTGQNRRGLFGRPWRDFLHATVPQDTANELSAVIYARSDWSGEWQNRRENGGDYPVRGRVTAVRNRHQQVTCFVAVYEDMTETRRHEAVLREAKERAEAGDQAKSRFLATMSHEVRTPLNGIVGFTNLLLETPLNAEQEEYMRAIRSSGEALIQLTNDILDSSRIESGKLSLERHACSPVDCIEDAIDMMATRADEKNLEIIYEVDEQTPEAVMTDPGRLRQVLLNLIGNAVKFTEHGDITITLAARALSEAGAAPRWELRFSVSDTGIGIDESLFPKLFNPFSQLEDTITRRYNGAGLGLSICRNLVKLMGGGITLTSRVGVGTTFTFTIIADEAPNAPQMPPPNVAGLRVAVAAPAGKLRQSLCQLIQHWGAAAIGCLPEELTAHSWDTAVVIFNEALVKDVVGSSRRLADLPRDKLVAFVPLRVSPSDRALLRSRFRLLVNRPVHHSALRAALIAPVAVGRSSPPIAAANLFDLRVLIVEDNPVNQMLLQKSLSHLGCQWAVAEHGGLALEELRRADYHLVLMDLHMPVMDGLTAIAQIRDGAAGDTCRTIWIAALTADARMEQKDRVLEAGANDYLIKPVRLKDLEALLRRFIAQRGGAA